MNLEINLVILDLSPCTTSCSSISVSTSIQILQIGLRLRK